MARSVAHSYLSYVVVDMVAVSTRLPTGLCTLAACSAETTAAVKEFSDCDGTKRPTQTSWGDRNMVVTTQLFVVPSLSQSLYTSWLNTVGSGTFEAVPKATLSVGSRNSTPSALGAKSVGAIAMQRLPGGGGGTGIQIC